eukprot:gb/GECH01001152.1/.p1 GENE.gb/GECH01001152.1/~~gb/GECH01001152.1/.p1  ORF type:complete len:518 (+),score=109.35 gb/GECH01001152.1/:1-1554(+)
MPERTDNVNGSRGSRNSKKHSFRNRSQDGRRNRHKKKSGKGGNNGGKESSSISGMKGIPTVLGAKPVTRNGSTEEIDHEEMTSSKSSRTQSVEAMNNTRGILGRSSNEWGTGSTPKTILTHSSKSSVSSPISTTSEKSRSSKAPTILMNRSSSQEEPSKQNQQKILSPKDKNTSISSLSAPNVRVLRQNKSLTENSSTKIISLYNNMELTLDTFFKQISESKEFKVIGILGPQGVGKSSILCELAGHSPLEKISKESSPAPFSISSSNINAETLGVDAYITKERVILLDCQPIFSPNLLAKLISSDAKLPTDVVSHENYIDLASTRLGLLMISICNVVVTVLDGFDDIRTLQFIQTICMLHEGMFKSSQSMLGTNGNESFSKHDEFQLPNIVFVVNKVPRTFFSPSYEEKFQHFLNTFFEDVAFQKTGHITALERQEQYGNVNFFQLPLYSQNSREEFIHISSHFTKLILSMPKQRRRTLSEKEWLQQSARLWENLKKSPFVSEYNRVHQKLQLYKT